MREMALSTDMLNLIRRTGGKDVALIVEKTEQAAKAKADLKASEEAFEEKAKLMDRKMANAWTQGAEQIAVTAAIGAGIGGAVAYIAHDSVVAYFGAKSWPALLALPAVGAIVVAVTPSVFKDKRSDPGGNATARGGAYGFGLGLLGVAGYLSYQDYQAA